MIVVVSIGQQKVDVYRGTTLVTTSAVSTGTSAHPDLHRRLLDHAKGAVAPLEHLQQCADAVDEPAHLVWDGDACRHRAWISRVPRLHSPDLCVCAEILPDVLDRRQRDHLPRPAEADPIEHGALFQPLPPPPLPTVGELTPISPLELTSSRVPAIAAGTPSPVILARAEAPTAVESDAQSQVDEESASSQSEPASEPVGSAPSPRPGLRSQQGSRHHSGHRERRSEPSRR